MRLRFRIGISGSEQQTPARTESSSIEKAYGSFRKLGVPRNFLGPYNKDPTV